MKKWEPWDSLLTSQAQCEAQLRHTQLEVADGAHEGLMQFRVVTLKAALAERDLDTGGLKAVLAALLYRCSLNLAVHV